MLAKAPLQFLLADERFLITHPFLNRLAPCRLL